MQIKIGENTFEIEKAFIPLFEQKNANAKSKYSFAIKQDNGEYQNVVGIYEKTSKAGKPYLQLILNMEGLRQQLIKSEEYRQANPRAEKVEKTDDTDLDLPF